MEREVNLLELIGRQAVTIETLQSDLRRATQMNSTLTKQLIASQEKEKDVKGNGVD